MNLTGIDRKIERHKRGNPSKHEVMEEMKLKSWFLKERYGYIVPNLHCLIKLYETSRKFWGQVDSYTRINYEGVS